MEQQIRNLGALIEDTNDNVRLIAENFVDVKKGISGLKRDVGELKKDVKVIKEIQTSHTEMIGQLLVDVTVIKHELKTKVNQKDFAKHVAVC